MNNILSSMCLVSIFFSLNFIQEGNSIKCWDCRSDIDPKCSDPFENKTFAITDCSTQSLSHLPGQKSTMCRKMRQKVNGVWKYVRSCAFLGEPGIGKDERFCLMRTGTYNIFMEYCTCNTKDGCNTSSTMVTYPLLFSLLALIIYVVR
ncbi:hypothetical protein WA026_010876 [Henosepilachna vigintioctopunctata]|uniref:Protein sleepless n=1 Tax=Henosepilachna vigintioctopunctata TaxID=420089 RepID=A0AAW1UXY8_9CUCU